MKAKFIILIFVILVFLTSACSQQESVLVFDKTPTAKETPVLVGVNFEADVTVGNNTYLPLNIRGKVSDNVKIILQVIDIFEKSYNYLEVVCWRIEAKPDTYQTDPYIYGIWVTHRPKN